MSGLSTHVLDTATGRPARAVPVRLEVQGPEGWRELGRAVTDGDGRVRQLLPPGEALKRATYRLTFDTASYLASPAGGAAFFPAITILFAVGDAGQHHHVPLLLSPYGYSTYRGS